MKRIHFAHRGQVLIIFVFAIIGLVGVTGLAIDGGNIYSNRRQAQNAADAAALSAAVVKVNQLEGMNHGSIPASDCNDVDNSPSTCGALLKNAVSNSTDANGFPHNIVDQTVELHIPPIDPPYSNCGSYAFKCTDYVQVIINTNVNTFFAKVLGIPTLHNRVQAVALAKFRPQSSLYEGNALVALNPHSDSCYGDFYIGGSGTVTLKKGGIFVNSDNQTCAFKITNTCPTVTLEDASITGVGGQFNGCSQPPYTSGKSPVQYPPDPLFPLGSNFPPTACHAAGSSYLDASGFTHYTGGHYSMLPPDKNTVLDNGVFCVDNVVKTTNPTTLKNGPPASGPDIGGVFIYIKPGGSFNFQGGAVDLHAPTSGMFKGYLLYVDEAPTNWFGTAPNCTINGSSITTFDGVIYAPHCDVIINGGSTPVGFTSQIVGYTISIDGTTFLTFTWDAAKAPSIPEVNWTGLFH